MYISFRNFANIKFDNNKMLKILPLQIIAVFAAIVSVKCPGSDSGSGSDSSSDLRNLCQLNRNCSLRNETLNNDEVANYQLQFITNQTLRMVLTNNFVWTKDCTGNWETYEYPQMTRLSPQRLKPRFQLQIDLLQFQFNWDLILFTCLSRWKEQSNRAVSLNCSKFDIQLLNIDWLDLESNVYERITVADFGHNRISSLQRDNCNFFLFASNLTSIDLSHNPIREIATNTFVLARNLRFLYLSANMFYSTQNMTEIFEINPDLQLAYVLNSDKTKNPKFIINECKNLQVNTHYRPLRISRRIDIATVCPNKNNSYSPVCFVNETIDYHSLIVDDSISFRIHELIVSSANETTSLMVTSRINLVHYGNSLLIYNCETNDYDLFDRKTYWSRYPSVKLSEATATTGKQSDNSFAKCLKLHIRKKTINCAKRAIQNLLIADDLQLDLRLLLELTATDNKIRYLGANSIVTMPSLIRLDLSFNPIVEIATAEFAQAFPELRLFDMLGSEINCMHCLLTHCKYLQRIKYGQDKVLYNSCPESKNGSDSCPDTTHGPEPTKAPPRSDTIVQSSSFDENQNSQNTLLIDRKTKSFVIVVLLVILIVVRAQIKRQNKY